MRKPTFADTLTSNTALHNKCDKTIAPGNRHEGPLFGKAFDFLKDLFKRMGRSLKGSIVSLDSAYDSAPNRKKIFNAGMIPNIKENPSEVENGFMMKTSLRNGLEQ